MKREKFGIFHIITFTALLGVFIIAVPASDRGAHAQKIAALGNETQSLVKRDSSTAAKYCIQRRRNLNTGETGFLSLGKQGAAARKVTVTGSHDRACASIWYLEPITNKACPYFLIHDGQYAIGMGDDGKNQVLTSGVDDAARTDLSYHWYLKPAARGRGFKLLNRAWRLALDSADDGTVFKMYTSDSAFQDWWLQ